MDSSLSTKPSVSHLAVTGARLEDGPPVSEELSSILPTKPELQPHKEEFNAAMTNVRRTASRAVKKEFDNPTSKLSRRFDKMCGKLGMTTKQTTAFKKAYVNAVKTWNLDNKDLTLAQRAALQEIQKKLEDAIAQAPGDLSRMAQFKSKLVTGFLACTFGFGAVVMLTKGTSASFPDFRDSSFELVNLAGSIIFLIGEVVSGAQASQSAGYQAVDSGAYQSYDTLTAKLRAKRAELGHLRHATSSKAHAALAKEVKGLAIDRQKIAVQLLLRESGWKKGKNGAADTVGSTMPESMRSDFAVDASGDVKDEHGNLLFTLGGDDGMTVTWPAGGDGERKQTNLKTEEVPPEHRARFGQVLAALSRQAKMRSTITDELSFSLFGLAYMVSGAIGPFLVAKYGPETGRLRDMGLTWLMCQFGTWSLVFGQNVARSYISGARPTHWNKEVHEANLDKADAEHARVKAFRTALKATHRALTDARANLALDPEDKDLGHLALFKQREAYDDAIQQVEELLGKTADATAITKAEVEKYENRLMIGLNKIKGSYQQYWNTVKGNVPWVLGKLAGYTIGYVIFSQVFIRYAALLQPHQAPPPINGTEAFNSTLSPLGDAELMREWSNYMGTYAMNGFAMALPFMPRNSLTKWVVEEAGWSVHRLGHWLTSGLVPADSKTVDLTEIAVDDEPAVSDPAEPFADAWKARVGHLHFHVGAEVHKAVSRIIDAKADAKDRSWQQATRAHIEGDSAADRDGLVHGLATITKSLDESVCLDLFGVDDGREFFEIIQAIGAEARAYRAEQQGG